MKKIVITSGFFNPIHIGHLDLIREAKKFGDFLVVIVNNDEQVKVKGSASFMSEQERLDIIKDLKNVDEVFLSVDKDITIAKSLQAVAEQHKDAELFFAKGGDRNINNIPKEEREVCEKYNIKVISGVGGEKAQSSSWLINNVVNKVFEIKIVQEKFDKMPSIEVLGNKINILPMEDLIELIDFWINHEPAKCHWIVASGMHMVVESKRNENFKKIISSCNLWAPDGISLVWLARLNRFKIKKRLAGPDLFHEFLKFSLKKGYKNYFYGSSQKALELLNQKLSSQMPRIKVESSTEDSKDILKAINDSKPDILWVDLDFPKQEEWIFNNKEKLNVPVVVGIRGSFNFESGLVKRAPAWIGDMGFEWLWRLFVEPQKAWKLVFIDTPQFIRLLVGEFIKDFKKNRSI